MDRLDLALKAHDRGFNCCQSVLAAFGDKLGIAEHDYLKLGSGFGSGAGTGELCGAVSGAIMVLDLILPADFSNPVAAKKAAVQRARMLQQRFSERFGHLRCHDLLQDRSREENMPSAVAALQLTNHCAVMIATAVTFVEEILQEEEK